MPFKSVDSDEHDHLNLSVLANFTEVNGELFYKNYKIVGNTQFLNILASQLSAGDWGGGNPVSIFEIVDNDDNTYSAWANGFGSGNKGWIKVDLGNIYTGNLQLKSDVALNAPWSTNTIRYYVETSTDGTSYSLIYSKDVVMTNEGQVQIDTKPFNARYIKWGLLDIGNGAGKMRTAYLKVSV